MTPTKFNSLTLGKSNVPVAPVAGCTFGIGAETSNAITVTGTLKDVDGIALAIPSSLRAYWSDQADGIDLLNTAHSSGTAIGAKGIMLVETVADKIFELTTNATGQFELIATEAGTKTAYLVVVLPDGRIAVSGAVTHA